MEHLHKSDRIIQSLCHAGEDFGEDVAAVVLNKRRKRSWEEASSDEGADPEARAAARKEAEMEADRLGFLCPFD